MSVPGYAEVIRESISNEEDIYVAMVGLIRVVLDTSGTDEQKVQRIRDVLAAGAMVRDECGRHGMHEQG